MLGEAIDHRKAQEARVRTATAALDATLGVDAAPRTVHQLGGAAAHREVLARSLSEAIRDLEHSRVAEDAARSQLGQALREREALDSLRSEAASAHRTERLRTEAARLDDLVTGRARPTHPSATPPRI